MILNARVPFAVLDVRSRGVEMNLHKRLINLPARKKILNAIGEKDR